MTKYVEIPPEWSAVIHSEVMAGHPIEELVFVVQDNGSLHSFGANPPGSFEQERKAGHCIVVRGIGRNANGEPVADITWASTVDGMLQLTPSDQDVPS